MHDCDEGCDIGRRSILAIGAVGAGLAALGIPTEAHAQNWGRERRDALSPSQIVDEIMEGNQRFVLGRMRRRDWLTEQRNNAERQYPAATFLTCIDSRAPVEVLCDLGIGDAFNARVAGNALNDDIVGSMEYTTEAMGAKVIMVMGHTGCGAISGAIDGTALGSLTLLLARFRNTIAKTKYTGDRTSRNPEFVDLVARNHVRATVDLIRKRSRLIARRERAGGLKIVGAMYDLKTGLLSLV